MEIQYSPEFRKLFKKVPLKVQTAVGKRLELFLTDPFHPLLHNHALLGGYKNNRSINITGDWRLIFEELESGQIIRLKLIGTHSQLYR